MGQKYEQLQILRKNGNIKLPMSKNNDLSEILSDYYRQ